MDKELAQGDQSQKPYYALNQSWGAQHDFEITKGL